MKNKKQIETIDKLATELSASFKTVLKDKSLSIEQEKVTLNAYNGLLFWRRTSLEEMKKEFEE